MLIILTNHNLVFRRADWW